MRDRGAKSYTLFKPVESAGKSAAAHDLGIFESWFACVVRHDCLFGQLQPQTLNALNSMRQVGSYLEGTPLFVEGELPRGLFILSAGKAQLSSSLLEGKSSALRFVEVGEVLGLGAVMGNRPYPATARTVTASRVEFIPSTEFLQFLRNHPDASVRVAEYLSLELHKAWASLAALE